MIAPRGARIIHYEDMERQVLGAFRRILFDPVVAIVKDTTSQSVKKVFNAASPSLVRALESGQIQYAAGVFSGKFNSATSKAILDIGGTWIKNQSIYRINPASAPNWVKSAAAVYQSNSELAHKAILSELDEIQQNLAKAVEQNKVNANRLVGQIAKDFYPVAKKLEINATLTPATQEKIATEYSDNMELWIMKWVDSQIQDLRGRVEENALQGYRFDKLIDMIKSRYNVSRSKAQFLARQETALFVSKYNEAKVKEAGVVSYKWSTAHDERVRSSHKHLDGTTQFYDHPPITDLATGARNNPGSDWNCRCVPIPILN